MKITYIANVRLPTEKAHGIQIMKTCEAFASLGHEVELIVPRRKNSFKEDPFDFYKVSRNFKITRLWTIDLVRFGRVGFLIQTWSFSERLFWYVLSKRPDIIYGRDEFPLSYFCLIRKERSKVVWETHTGAWNFFARICARASKGIVTISEGLQNFYIEKGIAKEKIVVAHDGIDLVNSTATLSIEDKNIISKDKKIVFYSGKLDGWKGVDTLLEASLRFKDFAHLVIAGGDEKQIQKLKEKYPHVVFLGFKSQSLVVEYQKEADVLVVPNTGKNIISVNFTSPLKVFEYMASGVPIVASDLPSIREVLTEKTAFFAEADNPESFAKVIKEILENEGGAKEKALMAQKEVTKYTWGERAKKILEFLK